MNVSELQGLIIIYGQKIILAIIVLVIGLILINHLLKLINKSLDKAKVDKSLHSFLNSIINISLKILLFITIASMLGVKMTSFIAILGAAGLAVGLALQGSLSNFAGGVLIILLKPFKVGDFIEGTGHAGTVTEIQVFHTILNTPDNRVIVIPNGNLSNSSVINYSKKDTRRVDLTFGVSYQDDITKVKNVLTRLANEHELILKDPAPVIKLAELGDSSINFILRVWCQSENYWTVHFDLLENVKLEFDKENISFPYPHMDVDLYNRN